MYYAIKLQESSARESEEILFGERPPMPCTDGRHATVKLNDGNVQARPFSAALFPSQNIPPLPRARARALAPRGPPCCARLLVLPLRLCSGRRARRGRRVTIIGTF
eukprot:1394583-Pleurochrysis_carterae.AAC.5